MAVMEGKRLHGKVDWYTAEKGYGVISGDDGRTYFIHHTNLKPGQKPLWQGMQVSFLGRPRPRKPGEMEAYDLEISSRPPNIVDEIRRLKREAQTHADDSDAPSAWEEVALAADSPAIRQNLDRICGSFGLKPLKVSPELVKHIDPLAQIRRDGKWNIHLRYRHGYAGLKSGSIAAMGDSDITLLVFVFSRKDHDWWVNGWVAFVVRDRDGRKFYMPPKEGYGGHRKHNTWRERFDDFMGDIEDMVRRAR